MSKTPTSEALSTGIGVEGAGDQNPESGWRRKKRAQLCVLGWETVGDWPLGLREEGMWAPGSSVLTLLQKPTALRGPGSVWPWSVPDSAVPVQALPLPRLPALGGGQEKTRGNPAGRAGRGRPVRGLGLGEEI